jgi:hypothetical protein
MMCHVLWILLKDEGLLGETAKELAGEKPARSRNHCNAVVMGVCRLLLEQVRNASCHGAEVTTSWKVFVEARY